MELFLIISLGIQDRVAWAKVEILRHRNGFAVFFTKILAADCTVNTQLHTVKVKKIIMQENCWTTKSQDCSWGMEDSRALRQDHPTTSNSLFAADALDQVNFLAAECKCKRDRRSFRERCNFSQGRGIHWQDTHRISWSIIPKFKNS